MDGFGILAYTDGRRYEGFFKDDRKEGFGIYKFVDNSEYSGFWTQNKQHGFGVYTKATGDKSHQCWINGVKKCSIKPAQV